MVEKKNLLQKEKKFTLEKIFSFITWLVSILVSLSVGAGMATKVLTLQVLFIPVLVTVLTGWVVIIGTIISILAEFFK